MVNLDELLVGKDPERTCTYSSVITAETALTVAPIYKLNDDCLGKVLENFINESTTLYQCILVNRSWCKAAIPLLWSNPFEYLKIQKYDHGWRLIRTYLNCLPDNEKHIVNKWILPSDLQKTLFDYPEFLKCLDTFGFQEAMTQWKRYHWKTIWERLGHFDLDKAIGDILFRRCNGLDSLYIIFFAYTQNIAYFEEPSNALTRLQTCKIIHDLQGRYYNYVENREQVTLVENFDIITKFAHNIKYLEIILPENRTRETGYQLAKLLKVQHNLEEFVVREFWNQADTNAIFSSLACQSQYLRSLSFIRLTHFHEKLAELLNSCPNLEILRFLEPDAHNYSKIPPLNCRLKNFCVWGKPMISQFVVIPDISFRLDIIRSIIETSSSTLKKLALGTFTEELCISVIQCINLKSLIIQAKEDISKTLPRYLSTSGLQQLTLFGRHEHYFNQNTIFEFSKSMPRSLYQLDLLLEILPKDLEVLFLNCDSPLKKISLYHQQNILEQNIPEFLTNYIGTLEHFIELRYLIDNKVLGEVYLEPILEALTVIPRIKIVLGKRHFYPYYFQDTGYF
ncbi:3061_t:CDS:1 [Funneliformis geosporum]|uniref:1591_t:CDS:1 n=1 Tax=Funneliformis geosporum TaxID=1117311 RepID=A0A9W4SU47_9GLOM|nr:1591_t:CDS:1 [Funneliformis geosporum]CAI2187729.1 3061_t:CDS:1 [Funneliformis geosporum]